MSTATIVQRTPDATVLVIKPDSDWGGAFDRLRDLERTGVIVFDRLFPSDDKIPHQHIHVWYRTDDAAEKLKAAFHRKRRSRLA